MSLYKKPDGSFVEVADQFADQARKKGYVPASMDQVEAARHPIQAGVEAAVRTALPLGLGEGIVTGLNASGSGQSVDEARKGQELRRTENPVAAAVGTGVGFLGPAKLLAPVTAPLRAAGLLGTAAAGALEGSALGLNEAVNESILQNKPLTAEKLAANVFESAATGAVMDFGMGVVAKGASGLLKKIGGGALSKTLEEAGTKTSLSMIESKSWAKKFGTFEDDIARVAREEGVLNRATSLSDESVAAAKGAENRVWEQMAEKLDKAQYVRPPNYPVVASKVMQAIKPYTRNPLADAAVSEVEQVLGEASARKLTQRELWDLQKTWRTSAQDATTIRADVLNDARKALRDAIMDSVPETTGDIGKSLRELNKRYAAISAFANGLEDATQSYKARGLGFKELAAGAYFGGAPGAAVAIGTHSLRKRGGFMLGETLSQLGKSDLMQSVAESLHRNLTQRMAVAPELFGAFRNTVEAALIQGPEATLDTHANLAMSRVGPEYLSKIGMEPESPEQMAGIGQRLSALDALQRAGQQRDDATQSAIDGLFGTAPGRKGPQGSTLSAKEFEKFRDLNRQILADPEAAYARIPPEITSSASETSGLAAMTMLRAAQFLNSKMPKDPYEGMPASVRPEWQPSAADLDRFNRYKEAVESPARVLKNMANGYISQEQVDALKAVYPATYADLQQKIGERLAVWQKPLTYQQRLAFSAILGPKALAMTPQQVQILQMATQVPAGGPGGPGGTNPSRPDGRQDVNEEQIQTEAQKLESR